MNSLTLSNAKRKQADIHSSESEKSRKVHLNDGVSHQPNGPIVFWFRKDLRITDNTGLYRASVEAHSDADESDFMSSPSTSPITFNGALISIFVICGQQWQQHDMAPIKLDFLFRNLDSLQKELESQLRIPLILLTAPSFQDVPSVVNEFCQQHNVKSLHYNIEYEVDELKRDKKLQELLNKDSIQVFAHHDECVVAPHLVQTKEKNPYTVFTPFRKSWYHHLKCIDSPATSTSELLKGSPLPYANSESRFASFPKSFKRGKLPPSNLITDFHAFIQENRIPNPTHTGVPGYHLPFESASFMEQARQSWPEGEKAAHSKLLWFSSNALSQYGEKRDIPSIPSTSGLSPYLALGVLSARQCVLEAYTLNQNRLDSGNPSHMTWISEVAWRDFYRHILFHFPRVCMNQPFKLETTHLEWEEESKAKMSFQKWCQGQTGYPIVDAAMRQLKQTGWMHNRVRMIAATFLVKDLLVDWRWGEKYFMQHLIDGDLASNNGGWQWCASTGTDSQPYFRVFNPTLQSTKFDPEGVYIKKYVHELANVPKQHIHEPHLLPPFAFQKLNYPKPIVDHKTARARAIEAFKKVGAIKA